MRLPSYGAIDPKFETSLSHFWAERNPWFSIVQNKFEHWLRDSDNKENFMIHFASDALLAFYCNILIAVM
jgi:hypothetical protein